MKSNKPFTFILRLVIGIVAVLLIWNPLVTLTHRFAQGPDVAFDMGDNYEIWGWPGYVIYWQSKEKFRFERIIHPERTLEFALKGPWLVGRSEKGWFAINKKTHKVHYPHSSKDELERIIAFEISSLDFVTDPRTYEVIHPHTRSAVTWANRFCWFLIFVLPLTLGFAPYIWKGLSSITKKE